MTSFAARRPVPTGALRLSQALSALLMTLGAPAARAQEPSSIAFNRDIRPILAEHCFYCHGQDEKQRQADLRLDQREAALAAGVLQPGEADRSELVARILADDPDLQMPPPDSNRRLTPEQKDRLRRWIAEGAEYQTHWAFVPPVRPDVPPTDSSWPRNEIDRFILAKLEPLGLSPSPDADRTTLIKRLAIDLTGLPPTPEEVEVFVADPDPQAYEKLVERFLASPHYGERMALSWLDAARYSDSNGFQQDGDTWQWLWRDWVVRALNDDLPFDQFTIWQLAGDLLPDATIDQRIASGFNRNHLLNGEGGAIPEEQRFVNLFDRVDTTATNWLGLTMACAQCHDHKFDPITMQDYYRLLDAFNRVPESGVPQHFSARIRVAEPLLELPTPENKQKIAEGETAIAALQAEVQQAVEIAFAAWRAGIRADGNSADVSDLPMELQAQLSPPAGEPSAEQAAAADASLRKYFDDKVLPNLAANIPPLAQRNKLEAELKAYRADQIPRVMIMSDAQPRATHILERGQYLQPLDEVQFAAPAFLAPLQPEWPRNRLGLAYWLVAPQNPLTARVQVNRIWQHFFGVGLVKTSEDFGVQSEYPLHRELLDWLAVEFRDGGWSLKQMTRRIVTSATYRQSSRLAAEQRRLDPANQYFARASRFRMPAMILRDWALASAGLLHREIGGPPVYPYQPENVWEPLAITKERDFTYPQSSGVDLYRRSLYTFWRRTVGPANMFDASNRQVCRVRATPTSTPLHALVTLNDPTWVEAARELAELVAVQAASEEAQIQLAFRRVTCREPSAEEFQVLQSAFAKQRSHYQQDPAAADALLHVGAAPRNQSLDPVSQAALTNVCLAILNLDESLTRE